jgi:predicted ATPase/class 3 adenylate cyclase
MSTKNRDMKPMHPFSHADTPCVTDLPAGNVTFLFTDIEGSTQLLERLPEQYGEALKRHDAILREAVRTHNGVVFETVGDAIYAAFARPSDAVASALDAQIALRREPWDAIGELRVRMALHTGEVEQRGDHYFGRALYRCARLMATGFGAQVLLSSITASLVRDALPDGASMLSLGRHRLKDLGEPEEPYQLVHPELIAQFPPLKSLNARPNNLPVEVSTFVGRARELSEVRSLLETKRVVTVTGTGGTGKTRLALQTAAEAIDSFPDGVFFVPLAAVTDPELVLPAIAAAVGVREVAGQSLAERLKQHFVAARLLLVLDNFEQLLPAARNVAELVGGTTKLKCLVTSRAPLRIAGEQEYPVAPLEVPSSAAGLAFDRLLLNDAVRLLAERATEVRPDFVLTAENIRAAAEICSRLDGLPLAIELAAARTKILDLDSLLRRLGDRLGVLSQGRRDAPARHRTLRAAIGWSYELLEATEREMFRRVAVFAGGFTLEAAEAVSQFDDMIDVLGALSALVDNSLMRRDETIKDRFVMLETIRDYALEQLASDPGAEAVRRGHAEYFLATAEMGRELDRDAREAWCDRLEPDKENIRGAIVWAAHTNEADLGLRLATAAYLFWWSRGHWQEGIALLRTALESPAAVGATPERAAALDALGLFCVGSGDLSAAQGSFEESVRIWRALGKDARLVEALNGLADVYSYRGEYVISAALTEEALSRARSANPDEVGNILHNLGSARAFSGDLEGGRLILDEALRERTDPVTVLMLGEIERMAGNYERSVELTEKALSGLRANRREFFVAPALALLALTQTLRGELSRARSLCLEGLQIARRLEYPLALAVGLEVLGIVEVEQGEDETAARLFGAADGLRARTGMAVWEGVRLHGERARATGCTRIGTALFDRAYASGGSVPLQSFLDATLEPPGSPTAESRRSTMLEAGN